MAYRKRGRGWQIDVAVKGHGRAREQFEGTEDGARLREAEVRIQLKDGTYDTSKSVELQVLTVKAAFSCCYKLFWRDTASAHNNDRYCVEFAQFVGPDKPLSSLTTADIGAYAQKLKADGLAVSTINSKLSVISKMVGYFSDQFKGVPKIPWAKGGSGKRVRYMTDEERRKFIAALETLEQCWHDFFIFYLDTGARPSEIRSLNARDLDNDIIQIWKTKSGSARALPLTDRARRAFTRACDNASLDRDDGRPFGFASNRDIRSAWDTIRGILGLSLDRDFVPYVCRHDCATRLYRGSKDLLAVQQWMGHANISQTLTYAKLFPAALREARDALAVQG